MEINPVARVKIAALREEMDSIHLAHSLYWERGEARRPRSKREGSICAG
jgi:hypothetical protein